MNLRMYIVSAAFFWLAGIAQPGYPADTAEGAATMNAYLVGNSLVRSITPTRLHELMAEEGIDFQFGSQLKGGFSLSQHWDVLQRGETIRYWESNKPVGDQFEPGRPDGDTLPKRFGSFLDAQKNHHWDALILQPNLYGIQGKEKELNAIRRFIDYSIEHKSAQQIYLYTSWLRRPIQRERSGKPIGLGNLDFQKIWEGQADPERLRVIHVVRADYREFIKKVNEEYAEKLERPILLIPFGDVICELDQRLKAGNIPGLEDLQKRDPARIPNWDPDLKSKIGANLLYADRSHPVAPPHLDGTIANYVMGLMFYSVLTAKSPVGLSGAAYELGDARDAELRKALQETVWDIVKNHPHTGVKERRISADDASSPIDRSHNAQFRKLKGGSISIARWKDDKTAAVTIFSSDGMVRSIKSAWTARNPNVPFDGFYALGQKYSIPFTFFIDPRQLDDPTFEPTSGVTPGAQPAGSGGTWSDWKFMHDAGYEIASHTYSHSDLRSDKNDPDKLRADHDPVYELEQAIRSIEMAIGARPISINPSYGPPAGKFAELFRRMHPVVRGDQEAEVVAAQHKDSATAAELIGALDQAVAEGKWLRVAGHGIRTPRGRTEEAAPDFETSGKRWDGFKPVEYSVLEVLCREVDERRGDLFVASFGDVVRYIKERNQVSIKILKDSADEIALTVTHPLDPNVFDQPITLKLSLNSTTTLERVMQNDKELKVKNRGKRTLFDVVPNQGPVTIQLN